MTADICGEQREIMVESGIPALLIGQDFYERALAGGDLAFEPSQAKIRLLNNLYEITYKANGELQSKRLRVDALTRFDDPYTFARKRARWKNQYLRRLHHVITRL